MMTLKDLRQKRQKPRTDDQIRAHRLRGWRREEHNARMRKARKHPRRGSELSEAKPA